MIATVKVLSFAYKLSGSSSVALKVEHKTSTDDWSGLFVRTGDTGSSWQLVSIRVPQEAVGLRLLSGGGAGDVVRLDNLQGTEAAWTDIACSFETDFCGWESTGLIGWSRDREDLWAPDLDEVSFYEGSGDVWAWSNSQEQGAKGHSPKHLNGSVVHLEP